MRQPKLADALAASCALAAASVRRSEDLCSKAWCLVCPGRIRGFCPSEPGGSGRSNPKARAGRRRSRSGSFSSARPEDLAEKLSPARAFAVARQSRRTIEQRAAQGGSLGGAAQTRRSGCCSFSEPRLEPGRQPGPKTMPASRLSRQPLTGRSKGPKTSFAPNKSRRFVPRWARPEGLAPLGSSPPVSSPRRLGPKTSPSLGRALSTSSTGSLTPKSKQARGLGR